MDPYLAQCSLVGFNFQPTGYLFAAGQSLPIRNYSALFSLLGTTFGGDGVNTFMLPNLQARVAVGFSGSMPMGESGGVPAVSLTVQQTPSHVHRIMTAGGRSSQATPGNNSFGDSVSNLYLNGAPSAALNPASVPNYPGSDLPHENMMPFLALNWIIAISGVFPPRN